MDITINGRSYALRVTWAAHDRMRREIGDDYTTVIQDAFESRDLGAIALAVSACIPDLDPAEIIEASPAIAPLWEAVMQALLISFYGPDKAVEEREPAGKQSLKAPLSCLILSVMRSVRRFGLALVGQSSGA